MVRELIVGGGLGALLLAPLLQTGPGASPPSAVVLAYHRFGESEHPSTSTPLEQLEAHVELLRAGGYAVVPLEQVAAALRGDGALPPRAVALTMDDAYASIFREAWPRLHRAGLPFTVFVSTDGLDAAQPDLMSWEQLRELAGSGVGIGHHGAAHAHPLELSPGVWRADLARASERFRAELGEVPSLLAYPYGEWSAAHREVVRELGFRAAFGQHSGVAWAGADLLALPRFALNTRYGELERVRSVVASLPLRVSDIEPRDPLLGAHPLRIRFRLAPGESTPSCFLAGDPVRAERDGDHIRISVPDHPRSRNIRLNCTLRESSGRWRWLGLAFFRRP